MAFSQNRSILPRGLFHKFPTRLKHVSGLRTPLQKLHFHKCRFAIPRHPSAPPNTKQKMRRAKRDLPPVFSTGNTSRNRNIRFLLGDFRQILVTSTICFAEVAARPSSARSCHVVFFVKSSQRAFRRASGLRIPLRKKPSSKMSFCYPATSFRATKLSVVDTDK